MAAADSLRQRPDVVFVLVGDGREKRRLTEAAEARGLTNLLFLPPVAKDGMADVLAGADAGLAILRPLALYATTYPNKVFDYMAAGRPVVLAIDGVIRKVVEEEGAGVAVPPGNPQALAEAVRTLADDRQAARRMGAQGRRAIELRFDRRQQAQLLEATFRQVVSR